MSFVQSAFLTGLAAIAVPVLIHLIYRWQIRRVDLGTIRFLTELMQETARRRRLNRWLLLGLRISCVALLVLLFARPYASAHTEESTQRQVLILIDGSASMATRDQGQRLVDRAAQRAREILRDAGDNVQWDVAFFDTQVRGLSSSPGSSREGAASQERPALSRIDAPQLLFGGTSYGSALSWARDMSLRSASPRCDLYVLTDLQRSGLDWTSAAAFGPHVRGHVEDLGSDNFTNVSIEDARVSESLVRPGEGFTCVATLFNYSPFTVDDVPVLLSQSNGKETVRHRKTVSIPSGQSALVEFEVLALSPGFWEGTVSIEYEDSLAFDNRRYFGVLSAPQVPVLIVDGSSENAGAGASSYFLDRAVRLTAGTESWSDSPFLSQQMFYESVGRLPSLAAYRIVVLVNVGSLSEADAARLKDFVGRGGGLLVFTGENVTPESVATLDDYGLTPGTITGTHHTEDLPFRWQSWDTGDPILEVFADPQYGDLQRLTFTTYTTLQPGDRTNVLSRFGDHQPALTRHTLGKGKVLWFLSAADNSWGGWLRSRLFVPLVHQLLSDLCALTGEGPVRELSLESSLDPRASFGDSSRHSGDSVPAAGRPGITQSNERWFIANVPTRESDTSRCTVEEFADRFQLTLADEHPDDIGLEQAGMLGGTRHVDELWHWVACLLLVFLALEWFVANRTTP